MAVDKTNPAPRSKSVTVVKESSIACYVKLRVELDATALSVAFSGKPQKNHDGMSIAIKHVAKVHAFGRDIGCANLEA